MVVRRSMYPDGITKQGLTGFDGDRRAERSELSSRGDLIIRPRKPISANNQRTDFALAA